MADKYKRSSQASIRDVFINNLKGKLGEEVVAKRLGKLVTPVDYTEKLGGDGKVDFTLTTNPTIGIQVKARHGGIDTVRWSIRPEEVKKNAALVCVLIQEEVDEAQPEYNLILAGFLPTNLMSDGQIEFGITELLYAGGLRNYLESVQPADTSNLEKAEAYYRRGVDHYCLGNIHKAIEDLNQALLLNPNHVSAYFWRGRALSRLGNYRGAIEDCTQAIRLNPNDPLSYKIRGIIRRKIGDAEGAISDFQHSANLYQEMLELKIIEENFFDDDDDYWHYQAVLEVLKTLQQ
jgi:tetratricopeptide (TPR) repeat protein